MAMDAGGGTPPDPPKVGRQSGSRADPQADRLGPSSAGGRSARAGGTLTMEPQHFAGCGTSGRLHGGEGGSDVDAPWATATLYGGASRS